MSDTPPNSFGPVYDGKIGETRLFLLGDTTQKVVLPAGCDSPGDFLVLEPRQKLKFYLMDIEFRVVNMGKSSVPVYGSDKEFPYGVVVNSWADGLEYVHFMSDLKKIFEGQSYPLIPAMYRQLSHLPKDMHERWHGVIQQAMAVILGENP